MTKKLLIDTDPGNDDATAIAFALHDTAYEIVGITTVSGNTTATNVTRNALSILELFDRTDVPVARGCEQPLCRDLKDAEDVHGPGGIRGNLPEPTTEPIETHASNFIVEQARRHKDELVIAAIGPMTNLALAYHLEPQLDELVADIFVMGGAAMTAGNTTPAAEFNFFVDPEAARHVIRHGNPRMVGLDVTQGASVPLDLIEKLADRPDPGPTIASWIGYANISDIRSGLEHPPSIHDAVVIVDIAHNILTFEAFRLDVGTGADDFRGAVSCDQLGVSGESPNAHVATELDLSVFRNHLRDVLSTL